MLLVKNLDNPDEKRSFDHGEVNAVTLGGITFAEPSSGPAGDGPRT